MARVVYQGAPDVRPAAPAPVFYRPDMPRLDVVGAAMQRAGGEIQAGGNAMAEAAIQIQQLHNETSAENAAVDWSEKANDLLYGENGLFAKTGADFLRARPQVMQQLDELWRQSGASLGNEQAQNFFARSTNYQRVAFSRAIGRAAAEAVRTNALDTSTAAIVSALRSVSNQYNDPGYLDSQFQTIGRQMQRLSDLGDKRYVGHDPVGLGATAAIQGAMAREDWATANTLLQQYGPHIDPAQRDALERGIHEKLVDAEATRAVFGPSTGSAPAGAPSGPVAQTIADRAQRLNIDPSLAVGTARLESDLGRNLGPRGNIFQLGPDEWRKAGGGDMADRGTQIDNGLRWLAQTKSELGAALGREPTNAEVYLAHQQGVPGAVALLNAPPGTPAGKVVLPENIRANGGDPNAPASTFVDLWRERYERAALGPSTGSGGGGIGAGTEPAAAPAAPPKFDLAFGDSIAVQQIRHGVGGKEGQRGRALAQQRGATAVIGDTPAMVLARLQATPPEQFKGRTIFLSPGTSNNPAQVAIVGQELDLLQKAGARAVVPGVGPGVPNRDAVNAQLRQLAEAHGAVFFEPNIRWQKDGIHPAEVDKLREQAIAALGRQAATTPRQPPAHIGGTIDVEGRHYQWGSGGEKGAAPIPPGNYPITPGAVGPWGRAHGAIGVNNNFIYDPRLGRARVGIELHAGSSDELITKGCVAIAGNQWPTFKAQVEDMIHRYGTVYLHVGDNGEASITPAAALAGKPGAETRATGIPAAANAPAQRPSDEQVPSLSDKIAELTRKIQDPQVLAKAIDLARVNYAAHWADQEHARQLHEQQLHDASQARANEIIADLSSGHPTLTAAQIGSDPALLPDTRRALLDMYQRFAVKQSGSDVAEATQTYGPAFWSLYKRVTAPPGDPTRITDQAEIMRHAGPGGDLTLKGVDALSKIIAGRGTPEAAAWTEMERQFFRTAHGEISGADDGLHIKDPRGEELYLKFMAQALPAIEKARAAGKTPSDIFDPNSPNYIGKSIAAFKRPMSQWTSDLLNENAPGGAASAADIDTPQALAAAFQAGHITRDQAQAIALAHGWIAAPATKPPAPASATAPPEQPGTFYSRGETPEQQLNRIGAESVR